MTITLSFAFILVVDEIGVSIFEPSRRTYFLPSEITTVPYRMSSFSVSLLPLVSLANCDTISFDNAINHHLHNFIVNTAFS